MSQSASKRAFPLPLTARRWTRVTHDRDAQQDRRRKRRRHLSDIVENRLVGMKSRGVYENSRRNNSLQRLTKFSKTLPRQGHHALQRAGRCAASPSLSTSASGTLPCREALAAFVDKTQEHVTGDVKLKLYKGNIINAGITSPVFTVQRGLRDLRRGRCLRSEGLRRASSTSSVCR